MLGGHGEVARVGGRRLAVVFELSQHLLEGEAQRLELLLFEPEGGRLGFGADDAEAERALAGLAKRLRIDPPGKSEIGGQGRRSGYAMGVRIEECAAAVKQVR
jgi:hypothetical protein